MSVCKKCGSSLHPLAKFCEFCGEPVPVETQDFSPNFEQKPDAGKEQSDYAQYASYSDVSCVTSSHIAPRSIVVAVILTIITCGLYGIYWMIKMNDEINELSEAVNATSGGLVFVFTLITCGIYGLYWAYKMGERCDTIKRSNGSSGILYLVLALLGFSIISYCLMQDTINKTVA